MSEVPLEISCEDVFAKQSAKEDFLFVDCREPDEFATARIEGAVLIPMSQLTDRVSELRPYKDKPIVVHCHHGGRSLRVVRWLRNEGYSQAMNMSGGIDEWAQKIDPQIPRY